VTAEIVSHETFRWILTGLTGGLAGSWVIYDSINLLRLRGADFSDPLARDRRFGYLIGIAIGLVGVIGCLLFHDVI
jgi:hypothetical protein